MDDRNDVDDVEEENADDKFVGVKDADLDSDDEFAHYSEVHSHDHRVENQQKIVRAE